MTPTVVIQLLCLALLMVSALWLVTLLELKHYKHWHRVWKKNAYDTLEMAKRHSEESFERSKGLIELCRKINQTNFELLAKLKSKEDQDGADWWKKGRKNGD